MTSLFREEALEYHARGARPGEPLRLDDRWPSRLLPVLLATLVLTTIAALMVHVPAAGGGSQTVLRALLGRG
jgi:hypothetical protein